MLKSIGKSWRGFEKLDTSKQPDPLTWPLITACADQCGDGECALNWLQRQKHINVDRFSDPSHGVACDQRLGLRDTNLWRFLILLTCVLNIPHGPWSESRFWSSISQAGEEYFGSFTVSIWARSYSSTISWRSCGTDACNMSRDFLTSKSGFGNGSGILGCGTRNPRASASADGWLRSTE